MSKRNTLFHDKKILFLVILSIIVVISYLFSTAPSAVSKKGDTNFNISQEVKEKFDYLSKNGNSSCSGAFRDSISSMTDDARLQGSCCSPMSMHRYSEQVEGLKKYKDIPDIPADPYDIEAGLAKKLMAYYDNLTLSPDEQKAYDYAMQNSDEKGPCCCRCWRWNVYGGLGKFLIKNYKFTGQQIAEIWNLSDGCGGDSEHHHVS